jgi:predicted O-linked N-acetylglucosamine transferase (SPINDLY family)
LPAALERLRRAAALDPVSAGIQNHLGNLHQDLGNQDAAIEFYRRAVEIDPSFAAASQNLGYLLLNRGEPEAALRHYEAAQRVQPQPVNRVLMATALPVVYESCDDVRRWRRRIEQSVSQLADEGLRIDTTNTLIPTTFFLAYQGENDREIVRQLGQVYQGVDLVRDARRNRTAAGGKIRVGFLSAYFRDHTIGRLNLGRIRHLSRDEFEVTVIAVGQTRDWMAEAFERAPDRFVRVPRQVAPARRAIADLDLDVLVFSDVGMDALTQSLAYSRMAPVQCATWGHPDTTGSPTMDYFLSSELLDDADAQAHYTEQLVRMPTLGVHYERPRLAGVRSRESFGLDPGRHVYLCPQTIFKFHPDFDAALAGILAADPAGDLVVLDGRLPNWTCRLKERWARTMPDANTRVRFLPAQPRDDFLHLLAVADVVIDPFPFGGGNTTYEALAVGTPVVTWPGRYLRGRITQALYRKMGLADCIAGSLADYIALATRIGRDAEYRRALAASIQAAAGVLFEDMGEVKSLEAELRRVSTVNC